MDPLSELNKAERPGSERSQAAILPFEKPQDATQRELRSHLQERLDRDSSRARANTRLSPTRIFVTLAIALIPVVLTFGSADAILRRVQLITKLYTTPSKTEAPAPAATETEDPGVLLMMPDPSLLPTPTAAPPSVPGTPAATVRPPITNPSK